MLPALWTARLHVGEQVPLKQGLKRLPSLPRKIFFSVGEQVPLKQGLKLSLFTLNFFFLSRRRAGSIKTRIETL